MSVEEQIHVQVSTRISCYLVHNVGFGLSRKLPQIAINCVIAGARHLKGAMNYEALTKTQYIGEHASFMHFVTFHIVRGEEEKKRSKFVISADFRSVCEYKFPRTNIRVFSQVTLPVRRSRKKIELATEETLKTR